VSEPLPEEKTSWLRVAGIVVSIALGVALVWWAIPPTPAPRNAAPPVVAPPANDAAAEPG
jgi:hypothetical protein